MANGTAFIRQAGALPVKAGRVCLITSSNGKRWIIPKGLIEPGQGAAETALQEAWEEAGLVGVPRSQPLGTYLYDKNGVTCHVTVFLMQVKEIAQDWPERALRQREWVGLGTALRRLTDPGLAAILRSGLAKRKRARSVAEWD